MDRTEAEWDEIARKSRAACNLPPFFTDSELQALSELMAMTLK